MKKILKNTLIIITVLLIIFLIFSNSNKEEKQNQEPTKEPTTPIKYFNQDSDKITIIASEDALYTDNVSTTLSYYALDNSNQKVSFKEGDRAFVRIMGVTHLYVQNTEIFHPKKSDGSEDNTIFSGKINLDGGPGKYLIKVCLGKSINLNSEGAMVWPFGCFEDQSSEVIDVYEK